MSKEFIRKSKESKRFFLDVDYFKPVNNSFRKKEANDEICIDT